MASITLAATIHTPTSELRPATINRTLVIEHDRALQKTLRRLFSSSHARFAARGERRLNGKIISIRTLIRRAQQC